MWEKQNLYEYTPGVLLFSVYCGDCCDFCPRGLDLPVDFTVNLNQVVVYWAINVNSSMWPV